MAATFAVVLAVAASTAAGSTSSRGSRAAADKITVWLQNDAESGWPEIVAAATKDFQAQHPGVAVDVQYQTWGTHLTKLDAALAGGDAPDVIEMGNTETTKYMAAGAFRQLTRTNYPNAKTWLQGLADSCTFNGKTYCVPYYARSRAVIYRKDMFTAAGITNTPASMDELLTDGQKLMDANKSDANYSALYFPGKYWYAAAPFVWDFGGDIATQSGGQWKGSLDSSQSQQGLTTLKGIVDKLSRADKTGDELKQDQAFSQGHIAMIVANGWEVGVITDPKAGDPSLKDKLGVFPIPSHTAGKTAPVFLGGSDLGIAAKSKMQGLAQEWVKLLTGVKFQTQMATVGQVIPNNTTLLDLNANNPLLGTFAAAAKNSRFVPNSPNWANVESGNVLQDMLVSIFTGKQAIPAATAAASTQVTTILNAKV